MVTCQPGRAPRRAILIAGYYRTGTSALSGALAEAGVTILNNTEANEHNPRGFFEDTALIQLEMDVLSALGSIWSDVRFLPDGWLDRPDMSIYLERLTDILAKKFPSAPLFAIKHPHICRLAPIYRRALDSMGVACLAVRTHRDPYVIATSQKKKNALPRAHALLLWASYVIDAERHTRDIPRALVLYDSLVSDPAGTVRSALAELGAVSAGTGHGFVTKTLRRSSPTPADGLYPPLGQLVADVERAMTGDAAPEIWDELRIRVSDLGKFLVEIAETRNRVVPGIGSAIIGQNQKQTALLASGAHTGNRLRPPERTDEAAKTRILRRLGEVSAPRLSVFVVAPHGMSEQCAVTIESLRAGWRQPDKLVVLEAGEPEKKRENFFFAMADDEALGNELRHRLNAEADTDYVSILNAGDTLEPDCIARMMLAASLARPHPAMLYCDEIVASSEHPWIRAKPAWDIHRLRESCFVGDWVWYATRALREIGGLKEDYPGAEEYDVQLRIAERGLPVLRVPEALFVRHPGSRRDSVSLETAIANAARAIDAHLSRCNIAATAKKGRFPGTFILEYDAIQTPMVIGLSCAGASPASVHAAAKRVLASMQPGDQLIYLAGELAEGDPLNAYLSGVDTEISPHHANIRVHRRSAALGDIVCDLACMGEDEGYVAVIDARATPDRDNEFDILRRILTSAPDAAIIGLRAYCREGETTRLLGPLLHGAAARIGAGRDAENPGPGAWLAAMQKVSAVDGPCIVLRKGSPEFRKQISGLTTWSEICEAAGRSGFATLWCPSLKSEVPLPDSGTKDVEVMAAAKSRYQPEYHHPALSLIGDPVLLESRLGLVEESPLDIGNLVSGEPDSHLVSIVRGLRRRGLTTASWVQDGVDSYSISRSIQAGRRWIRINPNYLWDEVSEFTALWTRPPSTSEHKIVKAAAMCVGTSAAIVRRLSGMGARRTKLLPPNLDRSLWERMTPPSHEKRLAIWIDEKVRVPWLSDMIGATKEHCSWAVVSNAELSLPGDVAKLRRPIFEDGWRDLFATLRPTLLVRPTPQANWLDDHVLLMAAAAGCSILAGRESFSGRLHARWNIVWLASDLSHIWIDAIKSDKPSKPPSQSQFFDSSGSFWLQADHAQDWLDIDPALTPRPDKAAKVA
jgi:hypothetical protein